MIDRRRLIASAVAAPIVLRRGAIAQEPLRVLGWGGYVDQGVIDRFRATTGVEVIVDNIGSYDEIFLRLRSGGLAWYSLVAPHHGLISTLQSEGLIQPLNEDLISRLSEVDPHFLLPDTTVIDGKRYAVPLVWGTSPAVYNADLLPEPPTSWADLDSDAFTGIVGMQDDSWSHFNVWGRAAGAENPPALLPDEFESTVDLLTRIKQDRVGHFTPYTLDLTAQLAAGKIAITTTGWEGMPLLAEANGANLKIARLAPGDFRVDADLGVDGRGANDRCRSPVHRFHVVR